MSTNSTGTPADTTLTDAAETAAKKVTASSKDAAKNLDKAADNAHDAIDAAPQLSDKAKDVAHDTLDSARDLGDKAIAVSHDAITKAGRTADDVANRVIETYENKPGVFWGVVGGAIAGIALIVALATRKR